VEQTLSNKELASIVRELTAFTKEQIGDSVKNTEPVFGAILVQALAESCAAMICEDSENLQKLLLIEEDFDLYEHAVGRLREEFFASILDVVNEEEQRLSAAKRLYTNE
jgi:hypothetical protein